MTAEELAEYIRATFPGVRTDEAAGDTFFTYDPDGDLPADRWHPFATIVTSNAHEKVSDLDHPGTYRLNVGLTTRTYTTLFGPAPTTRDADGTLTTGHDHAARDTLIPHPVYANQHWAAVIDPATETTAQLPDLLADAYDFAVRKHHNRTR